MSTKPDQAHIEAALGRIAANEPEDVLLRGGLQALLAETRAELAEREAERREFLAEVRKRQEQKAALDFLREHKE